jgi:flagellar hook-associated protein 1 FlgK
MAGYEIGISGLHMAQSALDVIGNNIANAATKGYHRQDINLRPAQESVSNGLLVGQGADFVGITRRINQLLEGQILRQDSTMSSLSRQMESLRSIESAFAELSTDGISTSLNEFYIAFQKLSLSSDDANLQSAVVSAVQALCDQLRSVASVVTNLGDITYSEAQTTVQKVNELAEQIAQMNGIIYSQQVRGFDSGNIMDQRDQLIAELNELAGVETSTGSYGQTNVTISGLPLVVGNNAVSIEANLRPNGDEYDLALSISGTDQYNTDITGGILGGLVTLRNSELREIANKLDTLAQTIISETNQLHVQGVGPAGSFTNLTGWPMQGDSVSDFEPPVSEGTIYVRVTAPDGTATRYAIIIDSDSTTQSIAEDFAAIEGLSNTTIHSGSLQITADSGYMFDFLPSALSTPSPYVSLDDSSLVGGGTEATAAPTIQVSGAYTGTASQDYTCTVTTEGGMQAIGTGTMTLTVTDGGGNIVDTINIGEGYESGDSIMLSNGLMISLNGDDVSPGYFNDGDEFTLSASVLAGGGTSGTAAPTIQVSGLYTGSVNQTYTCTVSTASSEAQAIGTGSMTLIVQDGSGATIASINIGQGFTASTADVNGTVITLESGITITLGANGTSPGYFNDEDTFTIDALADSDTSGFLAAAGINCFFAGTDASSITLSDDIAQSGRRIAVSRTVEQTDQANALAIAQLGDAASASLGGISIKDYYRNLTVDVGNQVSFTQTQYDNAAGIQRSLSDQRDKVSGVDINDQAMQMMLFERMFQAMSRYMSTISDSLDMMMTIIS